MQYPYLVKQIIYMWCSHAPLIMEVFHYSEVKLNAYVYIQLCSNYTKSRFIKCPYLVKQNTYLWYGHAPLITEVFHNSGVDVNAEVQYFHYTEAYDSVPC